jgi:parallel beta-helix repeat protein
MRKHLSSRFVGVASLVLALESPALSAQNNQTNCTPTINSCGCVIASSGTYKVGLNLTAAQGLNDDDSCISIAASYVTVDFGKKTITNSGSRPSGIGISTRKGVHTLLLEGRGATVSGWDVGILFQGKNSTIDNFVTSENGTAGVELSQAKSNTLVNLTANSNTNYGVWVRASSYNQINNLKTQTNGNVGTYVGCAALGPTGACVGIAASNYNWLFTENIGGNTNYGIALDVGANVSIVINNTLGGGAHNGKFDLFDANSNCGSNQWISNDSTATVSPATCVK